MHCPGKRNTQQIELQHLTLRTRIKRLVRKTICFSKTIQIHDIVIGLFVNLSATERKIDFAREVSYSLQQLFTS